MNGLRRLLLKELIEILGTVRGLVLVLFLPAVVLVFVGHLRTEPPHYRLLIAGHPGADTALYQELAKLLSEVSQLHVTRDTTPPPLDPLSELQARNYDLLLSIGDVTPGQWALYTAETTKTRISGVTLAATGIERAMELIRQRDSPPQEKAYVATTPAADAANASTGTGPDSAMAYQNFAADLRQITSEVATASSLGPASLYSYFPAARSGSLEFVPIAIAMILCLLPFVIALTGFTREREEHTIETLLAAPGITAKNIFASKSLFPVLAGIGELMLLLILTQALYGIQVKSGAAAISLLVMAALLASAFSGLLISSLVTTNGQAMITAAVYFLAVTLLSGFVAPPQEAAFAVQVLSSFFPLTFLHPALSAWFFGGGTTLDTGKALATVGIQCLVYGVLAWYAFRYALRRV